jgi:tRNA (guanine-N7-)-methyltransferase
VERATEWCRRLGYQGEVAYFATNATISLHNMLAAYPGRLSLVAIQFPDPHFKRRHYKRRIFQPQLVRDVVRLLPAGGEPLHMLM